MTSAEKILAGIIAEAEAEAEKTLAEAEKTAQSVMANAKAEAERITAETDADIARQTALIKKTGESSTALILRDAALVARRELIDGVLQAAKEKILSLEDGEYFDLLWCIAEKSGCREGVLYLNAQDKVRNTFQFEKRLADKGITLCSDTADIDGGFILKNGDIEINASISALIHEKHSQLIDSVNTILFTQEGES